MNSLDISYQDKLRNLLKSIRRWETLTGFDKEFVPEVFMDKVGELFLEYYQFHPQEAKAIGEEFINELSWSIRFINVNFVYRMEKRLGSASSWDDPWPLACMIATNIEAFGMMFGEITCELDAGGIWEYIEDLKESKWLEPHERPKNVPKYHWWWFTEFKPRGFCL